MAKNGFPGGGREGGHFIFFVGMKSTTFLSFAFFLPVYINTFCLIFHFFCVFCDLQVDCEDCGEKKDARMRTCLEHLPNLLIVHLKRFELDYSTFETVKLNDRCSFPMVLDVKPYTMKGTDERYKSVRYFILVLFIYSTTNSCSTTNGTNEKYKGMPLF